MYKRYVIHIICVALSVISMSGQSSSNIKRDQRRNKQQVEQAQRNIKQNIQAVENNLRDMELLDGQIEDIGKDLRLLNRRSDSINRLIRPLRDSIADMNRRLGSMCSKYQSALRKSQTNANGMNDVTFVFSSSSFRQAWERYRSLRQFSRWRQRKATEITDTRASLMARQERLDSLRAANRRVLNKVQEQHNTLERKRVEIEKIVKSLRNQNKQLQQVLKRRQEEAKRLDEKLEQALARELEERRKQEEREARERERLEREARQKAAASDTVKLPNGEKVVKPTTTPSVSQMNRELTGTFENNKGKLPYPVNGDVTVVKKFGRQKHPRLSKVETNNPGIDIETPQGASVHAVFNGEVSQIFRLAGYNNVVVVRHGDYVTVYANIASLNVKKGDKVTTGQQLGKLYVDKADGNRSILHFELRHEKDKQDPELWLRK